MAKPDKDAVMPNANSVRGGKLFDTEVEAVTWADENKIKEGWVGDHRPGVNTRCENYCLVSEYCEQFQALQAVQIGH